MYTHTNHMSLFPSDNTLYFRMRLNTISFEKDCCIMQSEYWLSLVWFPCTKYIYINMFLSFSLQHCSRFVNGRHIYAEAPPTGHVWHYLSVQLQLIGLYLSCSRSYLSVDNLVDLRLDQWYSISYRQNKSINIMHTNI